MFSVVPTSTPSICIFRLGRRLAHEGAHSGRRNFKPIIPSESKDNCLRVFSGNSSARTGQATGENCCSGGAGPPHRDQRIVVVAELGRVWTSHREVCARS